MLSEKSVIPILDVLKKIEGEKRFKEPLYWHTSFRVGGKADVLFYPKNEDSLIAAIRIAKENDIPIFILGNGSNLLIRDGGIHGLVISVKKMEGNIELEQTTGKTYMVTSSAGVSMPKLVRYTVENSLVGIETLIGVPGTLGGALKMNAGAEGTEISDVLRSVKMINMNGEIKRIIKDEIRFYYRRAEFPGKGVFLNAEIELKKGNRDDLLQKIKTLLEKRNANQPIAQWGAGSVFKNPAGHYAGQLIESAGLKGYVIGDAEVSPKHANFIINRDKAKAKDIEELIKLVQEKVLAKTGVALEPEIEIAGEEE